MITKLTKRVDQGKNMLKTLINKPLTLIFLTLLFIISFINPSFSMEKIHIKNIKYLNNNIIIETAENLNKVNLNTKISRLAAPDRIIIDIPESILIPVKLESEIKTNPSGISQIKAAQFSAEPDIVRIVIYSAPTTSKNTKGLSVNKDETNIVLKIDNNLNSSLNTNNKVSNKTSQNNEVSYANAREIAPKPPADIIEFLKKQIKEISLVSEKAEEPIKKEPSENMVIKTVKASKNKLTISGNGTFTERKIFTLENPSRLVFDFNSTKAYSNEIIKTYEISEKDKIKIGQFTPDTLRVVIETESPELYKSYLSSDMKSFTFSAENTFAFKNEEEPKQIGKINDINIKNIDSETISFKINTSSPAIYNLFKNKNPNELCLELYNIALPENNIIYKLKQAEQFKGIKTAKLSKINTSSVFIIPINEQTKVEANVSGDGQIIELLFKLKKQILSKPEEKIIPSEKKMYISPVIRKVVIDPGHGGSDVGAMRGNIYEKDINIEVSKKLAKYLKNAGVDVIFTRTTDESLSLKDRTVITNKEKPDVFVSVHVNASTNNNIKGIETHWYTPQSKELANIVQDRLIKTVPCVNRGVFNSMFYVIHHTEVPAVLVEIGFISNDNERNELLLNGRQEATAKAIAEGIIKFIENKYKP